MRHVPVLLEEVVQSLELSPNKNIIDATLGDGGHSERILEKIAPQGKLLGIDADPEAILRAKHYLQKDEKRCVFFRGYFDELKEIVESTHFQNVGGILADLGWSSPQFEQRGRGFSFQKMDERLDMRFSGSSSQGQHSASEILNEMEEIELARIFHVYGEEKLSKEIAEAVVMQRKEKSFEKVQDLVEVVLTVYRKKLKTDKEVPWIGGLHPATKVFQALRIAVNDELHRLESFLKTAVDILDPGGIIAIISFHSLEDRIVKHFFKSESKKQIEILTKKPIIPNTKEQEENPRSRSAKLRVAKKL
ncbi:MAG: hypothetical protein COV59_03625 [Candidatus Magasanikbacteria bacterium CG11_big_fil_rev_8_21_14_0_20_39_34]|uniref:Ribosomal RNA small subunit methyltransferase H n=1 Tax=Candidatus Magasanikbacteria bacterium CG11_big_fil_rev_8_21_14_0_20_39_34 TaxID=1974653 RepID=A0A2H0N7Z6_9BACT|nr:MAG: hypothetical protein COV59_03625 [Candidatus Magasanikbacteria bacterium CG11_big_fil_rev_8_21_14_0_20_39_34]